MDLSQIPGVRLQDGDSVTFQYLVINLELKGEKKSILRGQNWRPYQPDVDAEIIAWTKEELDGFDFFDQGGDFLVEGGGTLTLNPYDETVALYGANRPYGPEKDRAETAKVVQASYPDHKISWFPPTAPEPAKKPVKDKPAAKEKVET